MRVYLIAPLADFLGETLVNDKVLNTDKRYALIAPASLVTVAALLGDRFEFRLCDEAIEDVDYADPAEVVAISVNVAQAARGIEMARRFRALGRTVIMGGPHVSLAPDVFDGVADCLVTGEFEPVAPQVAHDLLAGTLKPIYRGSQADLSLSPRPRWDLYRNDRAISGVIQTSRGCPFECNFCDVIQYLGRKQRHKPIDKVLAEAQDLYDHGYRLISLSDDNFTVNRRKSRALLEGLASWNGREGRDPVQFSTQASIDLARDPELIAMCNDAGLREIFVGIESSNEAALAEASKRQNLRRDLIADAAAIVSGGIMLLSGMMVGFDSDGLDCFDREFRFGMQLPVVNIRVTVLVAPVATPLFDQLKAEGRLYKDGSSDIFPGAGLWTNIDPRHMSREQLAEGAQWLVTSLYEPDNAIKRFTHMAKLLGAPPDHLRATNSTALFGTGSAGALDLIRTSLRDPGARRVIEAVNELSKSRPEIARDLSSALAMYLNTYRSIKAGHTVPMPSRHHDTAAPKFAI